MKKLLFAVFALFSLACHPQQAGKELASPEDFEKQISSAENPQLIDVRTPKEFNAGHLEGAKNIHLYDQDFGERIDQLDKNKTVYVYCKAGGRSAEAVEILQNHGFKDVVELDGGTDAWSEKQKPLKQ